jgi:uncharacterized protein YndB with AHSA1/START domain
MNNDNDTPVAVVDLTHIIKHPIEHVYNAWTDQEKMSKWFCIHENKILEMQLDVQVGGDYRITMQTPKGDIITVAGQYTEVDPAKKLAFTWKWDWQPEDAPATHVTLTFNEHSLGTELRILHKGFADETIRGLHREGWSDALFSVETFLSNLRGTP